MDITKRKSNFLEKALDYAKVGWYVFPLKPKGKFPVISKAAGGNGFYDGTTDLEQIKTWWTKYPTANVGIACGVSDLYVVDCDYGLGNEEEFQAWRMRNNIPVTYTVRTGRRAAYAVQMYYSGAVESNGKWELDGCKGEIRSVGGYVCAPPSVHPDTDEAYQLLIDAPLSPRPNVIVNAVQQAAKQSLEPRAPGEYITENRNMALTSEVGKYRHRNPGVSEMGTLAAMLVWNDENCRPALPEDEVANVVTKAYRNYPDKAIPPTISIGKSVRVTADLVVGLVEELDPNLRATPLPKYPLHVWDDTLYLEFAKRAAIGNYVPLEFFVEGAMTCAGSIAGITVRHKKSEEITLRMYTALLASAGIGKGTTFRRIRKFAPARRILDSVAPDSPVLYCASLLSRPASENGLNESLLQHPHVLLEFEEMDQLMGKTEITGNGAILSIIRTCFDDIAPGITTCKGRPVAASTAFLSLLGAMTPSLWRKAMEGRDSYGSGLGGRFNLVASNEDRTASTLVNMEIGDLQEQLNAKFTRLDKEELIIDTEPGALKLLADWWDGNSRGRPHYNRVNVIAHRKAMHLAWMRGTPIITAEIMRYALLLADYLVGVRDVFAVSKGDDRTAIGENKVLHILRHVSPKAVTAKQIVSFLDGMTSRSGVFGALKSLVASGEVEQLQINPVVGRPYAVFRVSPK